MGPSTAGLLCDITDAAMGTAYAATLDDAESFTTLELKINFLPTVCSGELVATARVVPGGKTVGFIESDIVDESGKLVARATCTCLRLRR